MAAKSLNYNEYVEGCLRIRSELAELRSEYSTRLNDLKTKEFTVRSEYRKRRAELQMRKFEHEREYREKISEKI